MECKRNSTLCRCQCDSVTGSLYLGIFSSVLTALAILVTIIISCVCMDGYDKNNSVYILLIFVLGFTFLLSVISFIFSVCLCYGVCNRKTGFMMAYFVFNCLIVSLSAIAGVTCIVVYRDIPEVGIYWGVGLLYLFLHSWLLVMVKKAIHNIEERTGDDQYVIMN